MAPPRHRGRGFSRRIQYGLFFGYVVAIVGVVVGIALILIARYEPLAFQGIRGLALDLTAPISGAGRMVVGGADSVGGDIGGVLTAGRRNAALQAELAALRREVIESRAIAYENKRLKRALRLIETGIRPIAAARIVGSDLGGSQRLATLAAGSAEGVRPGQPVRGPDGLIGRVAQTGRHAARVVLLTDAGSTVPVRVVRTGQPALVEGHGDGRLDVRATATGGQPLRRGDLLVTSGTGGVYPPGLPVAVVTGASGEIGTARPLANPAALDLALILPEAVIAPPPATVAPVGIPPAPPAAAIPAPR